MLPCRLSGCYSNRTCRGAGLAQAVVPCALRRSLRLGANCLTAASSSHPDELRSVKMAPTSPEQAGTHQVGSSNSATANFGIMVASGSPAIAEAVAASGVDWLCIDAQHGAVTYEVLGNMLAACSSHGARVIVRVGGPSDRFGIQQALDLGAHGIMVPLVNSRADAEEAVSYCLFAPAGQRSVAYPVRAVYHKGVGGPGLSRYLAEANREVEVWLQVETKACFESLDDVLSVPGITSAFLGPCDLGITYGLHVKYGYDVGAMIASPDLAHVYDAVLQACNRHRITAGVFCLGEERAAALAGRGFTYVAYDTDLGAMMSYTASVQGRLKPSGTTTACAPEVTTTKMARSSVGGDVEADVPHAS